MSEMPWILIRLEQPSEGIPILRPTSAFAVKHLTDRFAVNSVLRGKFSQPRSYPHHNLYWKVLDKVVEATGNCGSAEDLHESIKIHLRMLVGIAMLGGGTRYITRSINFGSMDQGEFRIFFKKAMLAIEEATGVNTDDVIAEIKKEGGYREAA